MTNRESPAATDDNALIAERRAKLARIREAGVAFPNDFRRDAHAADLHATWGGKTDEWLAANPSAGSSRRADDVQARHGQGLLR